MIDNTVFNQVMLSWAAVGLYIGATFLFAAGLAFSRDRLYAPAMVLGAAGLLPHGAAIVMRWIMVGHGPYMARFEVLSSMAWISVLLYLLVAWRTPRLRCIGAVVMPLCFLMMVSGLFTSPEIRRLPPSLRSVWLVVHVLFNKVAAGSMIIAFGTSVLYLFRERKGDAAGGRAAVPLEILDAYSYRFVGFGFLFWSITTGAGAIWANEAWGRYWGWDPIETWSLITWLLFGLYLHLRRFHGWKGRKAAWLVIVCFAMSIFTLFILPLLGGSLHSEYFSSV